VKHFMFCKFSFKNGKCVKLRQSFCGRMPLFNGLRKWLLVEKFLTQRTLFCHDIKACWTIQMLFVLSVTSAEEVMFSSELVSLLAELRKKNYSTDFHKFWWKGGIWTTEEIVRLWSKSRYVRVRIMVGFWLP